MGSGGQDSGCTPAIVKGGSNMRLLFSAWCLMPKLGVGMHLLMHWNRRTEWLGGMGSIGALRSAITNNGNDGVYGGLNQ